MWELQDHVSKVVYKEGVLECDEYRCTRNVKERQKDCKKTKYCIEALEDKGTVLVTKNSNTRVAH